MSLGFISTSAGLGNTGPVEPEHAFALSQSGYLFTLNAEQQKAALEFVRSKGAELRAQIRTQEQKDDFLKLVVSQFEIQQQTLPAQTLEAASQNHKDPLLVLVSAAIRGKTRPVALQEMAEIYNETTGQFLLRLLRRSRKLNNSAKTLRRYILYINGLKTLDELQKQISKDSNKPFYVEQSLALTDDEVNALDSELRDWAGQVVKRYLEKFSVQIKTANKVGKDKKGKKALRELVEISQQYAPDNALLDDIRKNELLSASQVEKVRNAEKDLKRALEEQVLNVASRDNLPLTDVYAIAKRLLSQSSEQSKQWQKLVNQQLSDGTILLETLARELPVYVDAVSDKTLAKQLQSEQWPAWKVDAFPAVAQRNPAKEYLAHLQAKSSQIEPLVESTSAKDAETEQSKTSLWIGVGVAVAIILAVVAALVAFFARSVQTTKKTKISQEPVLATTFPTGEI